MSALRSPAGYEQCYDALRALRQKKRGRPVFFLRELAECEPVAAALLSQRVNFKVPSTTASAVLTFICHPTALFIIGRWDRIAAAG